MLNYVDLALDLYDGSGARVTEGWVRLSPSVQLTDTTDHHTIIQDPIFVSFYLNPDPSSDNIDPPVAHLVATDNENIEQSGWVWDITFPGIPGNLGGWSFELNSAESSQHLSDLVPAFDTTQMASYLPIRYGTGAADGKVWTSDASGLGSWEDPAAQEGSSGVTSVNGDSGPAVTLTAADVGADPAGAAATAAAGAVATAESYADGVGSTEAAARTAADLLALKAASNLSDVQSAATARTNLGAAAASALTTETTRATTAEGLALQISGNLGDVANTTTARTNLGAASASALTSETSRATTAEGLALQIASNLSDVQSAATARTNLGLGTAATQASTAFDSSGAASAAQTAAINASAQRASNLSDLANAATARTNLGLGTAATQASSAFDAAGAASTAQTAATTAAVAVSAQRASNLSDLANSATARTNLGLGTAATQASSAFDASGAASTAQTAAIAASAQRSSNLSDLASAATARTNLGLGASAVKDIISGQYLCPPTQYAPASATTKTITGQTLAAFDSTNINTGNFTVPASGSVKVEATFEGQLGVGGEGFVVGICDHGTVTPVRGNLWELQNSAAATPIPYTVKFLLTGLTPGSTQNFDLVGCCGTSGATVSIVALGQSLTTQTVSTLRGGPVIMEVRAV